MKSRFEIIVYSRPGCHLCDEALAAVRDLLARHAVDDGRVRAVNVETDPSLEAAYGREIPVLAVDGGPPFPFRRDIDRLEKALEPIWTP
jgi:hypothetical protein